MRSFKQYCQDLGLGNDSSPERLAEAKSTYNKWYQKAYRENRKAKVTRREIALSSKENKALLRFSNEFGLTPSQCIKYATLSVISSYSPNIEPKALAELILQLRRIGTNINQMSIKLNQNQIHHFNMPSLQQYLMTIEGLVRQYLGASNMLKVSDKFIQSHTRKSIQSILTNDY